MCALNRIRFHDRCDKTGGKSPRNLPLKFPPLQVYDTSGLVCSNGGIASVAVTHQPGDVPDGAAYDQYVRKVESSDEGVFEHTITDLVPGNVSESVCRSFCLPL